MSRDKYADKKPVTARAPIECDDDFTAPPPYHVDVLIYAPPKLPEPDETACLRIARWKSGELVVQLEINDTVVTGGPGQLPRRESLANLARAIEKLRRMVAVPVGRAKR